MPINPYRDSQGRARFEYEFSRRINGRRVRVRKSLPAGWSRAKADAFDHTESARLYGVATGTTKAGHLIESAVARYIIERVPELKHGASQTREIDLLEPWFRGKWLGELPSVCAAYLKDSRATLAPATIKNRLRYLVAACRYAWRHHRMGEHDPGAGVVFPAVSNERQVYIDRAQMLRLAKACGSWEVRAMIRIAFYSGMRLGEIQRARVEGDCWVLDDTKNGQPRIVPMAARCRAYSDYAWPSKGMVAYWVKSASEVAKLPGITFHTLRHSAASAMLNGGVHMFTVGAVLGHKSAASMKRYGHLSTASTRAAIERIGRRA